MYNNVYGLPIFILCSLMIPEIKICVHNALFSIGYNFMGAADCKKSKNREIADESEESDFFKFHHHISSLNVCKNHI